MTDSRLILLGASIRSPAQSAALAQIPTWGADLFADMDTQAVSAVRRVENYPHDLATFAEQVPRTVWMYGGALENYPRVVERLSKTHALAGNPSAVLEKVRDFHWVAQQASHCGLKAPRTLEPTQFNARKIQGRWLRKPKRSSAGLGIQEITQQTLAENLDDTFVAQQLVDGDAGSCAFLSTVNSNDSRCEVLGVTHSFPRGRAREAPLVDQDFRYQGSYGPGSLLSRELAESLENFGDRVTEIARIRGLWGLDFVENDQGLWVLEINPRWSASFEILERHEFGSLMPRHLQACQPTMPDWARDQIDSWLSSHQRAAPAPINQCWGKRIVYSDRPLVVDAALLHIFDNQPHAGDWPLVADLPPIGTEIGDGHPICTIFAVAPDSLDIDATLTEFERILLDAAWSVL